MNKIKYFKRTFFSNNNNNNCSDFKTILIAFFFFGKLVQPTKNSLIRNLTRKVWALTSLPFKALDYLMISFCISVPMVLVGNKTDLHLER